VLERARRLPHQRIALELLLRRADEHAPERPRGELAHPHPVLERRQVLAERVDEGGQEPDLVHGLRGEGPPGDHEVRDVGRVERAAQEGDVLPVHRLRAGLGRHHRTETFPPPPSGARSRRCSTPSAP